MEKFMQRENGLLGYAHHAFPVNSPKTPHGSSDDMDFNDVFGGPPRRSSVHEVRLRYSFGEPMESEEEIASSPWSSLNEKPVFGEESRTPRRRRHRGDNFFEDIFKGDEPYSSPRRADRDRDNTFGSNPGSRILSPSRPLPPKAEPFCTSSPAQFRFSGQVTKIQDEIRNDIHPVCRQSPLSHEASFSSEDQPPVVTSDQKENTENWKEDRRNVENLGNQFHFSFYKWAGLEVTIPLRLVGRNNMKPRGSSIYDRSASSERRIDSKSSTVTKNESLPAIGLESLQTEHKREDLGNEEEIKEQQNSIIEEVCYEIPESKSQTSANNAVVFGVNRQNIKDEQVKSLDKIDIQEKTEKIAHQKNEEPLQSELKPLYTLLSDEVEKPEMKRNKDRIPKGIHTGSCNGKNVKENEGIGVHSNYETVDKSSLQAAAINSGVTPGENGVKRKVRQFVQIFNQEADSGPKANFQRSWSSRWKAVGIDQTEKHYSDKNPDISVKVDENLTKDEAQHHSPAKTPMIDRSSNQKNAFSSDMFHSNSTIYVEHFDDALEDDFLVQELSDDHQKGSEGPEDTKAIDAKIRQWSFGKKGNIRSLLSTLQFVLWPESGWKPVPLANLIETNSVKRAYQKALLHLHPDKLQQKDAAFHQKYIAEKVFDILQEAWDQFNALVPLTI